MQIEDSDLLLYCIFYSKFQLQQYFLNNIEPEQNMEKQQITVNKNTDDPRLSFKNLQTILTLGIMKFTSLTLEMMFLNSIKILLLIHTILAYALLKSEQTQAKFIINIFTQLFNLPVYRVIQIILYSLKIIDCFTCYCLVTKQESNILYSMSKMFISKINIVSQVDLSLSAFLLFINVEQNIVNFLLSIVVSVINSLFLTNSLDRKDLMYVSSLVNSFTFSMFIIFGYITNIIFVNIGGASIYGWVILVVDLLMLVWYISEGYQIYITRFPKYLLLVTICLKISISLSALQSELSGTEVFTLRNTIQNMLIIIGIFGFTYYSTSTKFIFELVCRPYESQQDLDKTKSFDIFLHSVQENHLQDEQSKMFMQSNSFYHIKTKFQPDLHFHSQQMGAFSRKKKRTRSIKFQRNILIFENEKGKQQQLRYFLKTMYHHAIKNTSKASLLIDYCQFLNEYYKNYYEICKILLMINSKLMSIFDMIRFYQFKQIILRQSDTFNAILFEGKMQLENIIMAEDTFELIMINITKFINQNMEMWKIIKHAVINATEIKQKICNAFQIIIQTNKMWKIISKYLKYQKRWGYIKINYSYFILNKKIIAKQVEKYQSLDNSDAYFTETNVFIHQSNNKQKFCNQYILFDKKSFYIRTYMNIYNSMEIINASKFFSFYAQYTNKQIIGESINILLPQQIREVHDLKTMEWLQKGQCAQQQSYPIRFTNMITKLNFQVPVIKYYKIHVNFTSSHMLEFICLLKVNEQIKSIKQNTVDYSYDIQTVENISIGIQNKNNKNPLQNGNNIFIKEDNLTPNQKISDIQQSKFAIRVMVAILILLIFVLMMVTKINADGMNDQITQFLNFLNLYRYPMALGKNYMKTFLNIGNVSKAISQISSATASVLQINSDPLTLKTIFDTTLNLPNTYSPFKADQFNQNISLDQTEIYFQIISSISSLNHQPINRTGKDFTMLNMYLIPGYDHMINSTKVRIHQSFKSTLSSMYLGQIMVLILQFMTFATGGIIVGVKIYLYYRTVNSTLEIIFNFSDNNNERIQRYWQNLQKHFQKLNFLTIGYVSIVHLNTARQISVDLDINKIKMQMSQQQNIFLNKTSKIITKNQSEKINFAKIIIVLVISIISLVSGVFSIEVVNINAINDLIVFENAGYYFLQYFPATSVLGHALLERYYNQVYPKQTSYDPKRYSEYVSDMKLIGESSYIGQEIDPSSQYFQKQKNYMFGNPCIFNPSILVGAQTTTTKCLTIYNKTFSQGITTFLRSAQRQVQDYINCKITLTSTQLDDLTVTLTLVAYYITDAITTWASEFSQHLMKFQNTCAFLCLLWMSLIFILHVVICEIFLFSLLESDYKLMRQIFDKMIPEYILVIEKLIKQKFIQEGVINQS